MTCALPEWSRCCCTCKHRREHYARQSDGTLSGPMLGYICAPPTTQAAYMNWPEHSLCELHEGRK